MGNKVLNGSARCVICNSGCGRSTTYWSGFLKPDYDAWYFDRLLSEEVYLCENCIKGKYYLMSGGDYYDLSECNGEHLRINKSSLELSKKKSESLKNEKASLNQRMEEIVDSWFDRSKKAFKIELPGLKYQIEGPAGYLLVFKNNIVFLGNIVERSRDFCFLFSSKNKSVCAYLGKVDVTKLLEISQDDDVEKTAAMPLVILKKAIIANESKLKGSLLNLRVELKFGTRKVGGCRGEYRNSETETVGGALNISLADHTAENLGICFPFHIDQSEEMKNIAQYIRHRIDVYLDPDYDEAHDPDDANELVIDEIDAVEEGLNAYETFNEDSDIVSNQEKKDESEKMSISFSPADELKKLKELFDAGILSRDEFDEAKRKVLDKY